MNLDQRSDYSECPEKQRTRRETLEAVMKCDALWDFGTLDCDWMETTGQKAPSLKMLIEQGIDPNRFIGINWADPSLKGHVEHHELEKASRDLLKANEEMYQAGTWHYGSFEQACREDLFPNVGVIVFDSHYAISANDAITRPVHVIEFFKQQVRRLGQAVLVINVVYKGSRSLPRDKAKDIWVQALADHLGLPVEAIPMDIYTSEGRSRPMALTRIAMDAAHLNGHR